MKKLLSFVFLIFLMTYNCIIAQTYANYPEPKHVLVVYNGENDTSGMIKDYYAQIRNIPIQNILRLDSLDVSDTVSFPSGNVYMDEYKEVYISDYNKGAWECYVDKIADPIEDYLNTTYSGGELLRSTIRYIVLCKGVPMKLLTYLDFAADEDPDPEIEYNQSHWFYYNVSIDALLCFLYNPVIDLYGTSSTNKQNPYKQAADLTFSFNNRFVTNYFHYGSWYMNYLTTRLDGDSYNDIVGMIYRATFPDYSGLGWWIMDADTCHTTGVTKQVHNTNLIRNALNKLKYLGFNTNPLNYDPECDWILDNSVGNNEPVMGYTSCGRHSWMKLCNPQHDPAYIQLCLDFNYANGAVFNTFESYNGFSMTIDNRYGDFGMLSEFIKMGGTGGVAHTWEPRLGGVALNYNLFNLYAMGYSWADAAYQSISWLAWNNVVIGDPLTAIAWGKQELTQYLTTWSDGNLVTGEITIPLYNTLIIEDDAYIELRHQGFIPCNPSLGRMNIGQDVTFETYSWEKALFLSYASENARIVWADHPTFPAILYNIYRKINDGNWEYITSTMDNEYTDEEVYLTCYSCPINAIVSYYVKGVDVYEGESEASNEVSAEVIAKIGKESGEDKQKGIVYEYSLSQNYPNPFNPTTRIFYSIKEAGMVSLSVYDILGNEVSVLVKEDKSPGSYSVTFNAGNLPSGIYFYKLTAGRFSETKKLILLK